MFERIRLDYHLSSADTHAEILSKRLNDYVEKGNDQYRKSAIRFAKSFIKHMQLSRDLFWKLKDVTKDDILEFENSAAGKIYTAREIVYDLENRRL